MEFCSLRAASCAWVWAWDWACDCWFIISPPQNWPWSPIGCGFHPKFHIVSGTLGNRPGNMAALSGCFSEKTTSKQMHPQFMQGSWYLSLTKVTKRKWPHLESMSCCLKLHVKRLRSVSWSKRKIVIVASGYATVLHQKRWSQRQRETVSTQIDIDEWDQEKKAGSSLYLDELLIQKCKFRDRFTVNR